MSTVFVDDVIVSEVPDIRDLPLDSEDSIDDAEYAHIMRRIGSVEGGPGTSVSAFNSSI
jgi:FXSXX-COOH protein